MATQSWAGVVRRTGGSLSVQTTHPKRLEIPFTLGNPDVEVLNGFLLVESKKSRLQSSKSLTGELPVLPETPPSSMLVVTDIPTHISFGEFFQFLGVWSDALSHMQIVGQVSASVDSGASSASGGSASAIRGGADRTYMMLMNFHSAELASSFQEQFNGLEYNSLERDICRVSRLYSVETTFETDLSESTIEFPHPRAVAPPTVNSGGTGDQAVNSGGTVDQAVNSGVLTDQAVNSGTKDKFSNSDSWLVVGQSGKTTKCADSPNMSENEKTIEKDGKSTISLSESVRRLSIDPDSMKSPRIEQHAKVSESDMKRRKVVRVNASEVEEKSQSRMSPSKSVADSSQSLTCPVCLESIEPLSDGMVTILCQHVFHFRCLSKWGDSTCPVCRFIMQPCAGSVCELCEAVDRLWICLICGHVGCDRYHNRHAIVHFESTGHAYGLEVDTQRVWDYAGDNYVHRLIQNKADGKLVQVGREGPSCSSEHCSKLDEMVVEYSFLLKSETEKQRRFFEHQLFLSSSSRKQRVRSLTDRLDVVENEHISLQSEIEARVRERDAACATSERLTSEIKTARRQLTALQKLNSKLISRNAKEDERERIESVFKVEKKRVLSAKQKEIQDLRDQIRDLSYHTRTQRRLERDTEAAGAQVLAVDPADPGDGQAAGRRRGGRRKQRR
eukprot:139093_1